MIDDGGEIYVFVETNDGEKYKGTSYYPSDFRNFIRIFDVSKYCCKEQKWISLPYEIIIPFNRISIIKMRDIIDGEINE